MPAGRRLIAAGSGADTSWVSPSALVSRSLRSSDCSASRSEPISRVVSIRSRRSWPPTFSTSSLRSAATSARRPATSRAKPACTSRRSISCSSAWNSRRAAATAARSSLARPAAGRAPAPAAGRGGVSRQRSADRLGSRLPNIAYAPSSRPQNPADRADLDALLRTFPVTISQTPTTPSAAASTKPQRAQATRRAATRSGRGTATSLEAADAPRAAASPGHPAGRAGRGDRGSGSMPARSSTSPATTTSNADAQQQQPATRASWPAARTSRPRAPPGRAAPPPHRPPRRRRATDALPSATQRAIAIAVIGLAHRIVPHRRAHPAGGDELDRRRAPRAARARSSPAAAASRRSLRSST